jgi:ubiquinone/menaquinone biosynthesis C-methylase UbiE
MCEQSGFQLSGRAPEMYERYIVPTLSAAKAQELVRLAALKTGERLLDVACGTGVVTRQAAQAVGPTGQVVGLDINEGMLRMARTMSSPDGASIAYQAGSVMAIPFPEATFDVVLCQYGLEFFPDRGQGLHEMGRVLTSEGRLGLRVWRALAHQAFHLAVFAALDRHLWDGQDVPSRRSFVHPFSLGDAEELRGLVNDAGFRDIDIRVSTVPIRLAATDTALLGYLSALPIGSEMAAMTEQTRTAVLQEVRSALHPFVDETGFVIPAASHVVLARMK